MKIASIVGARPNFVKLAPVSRELRKAFDEKVIHTGQHYDYRMNEVFFDELAIPAPDYHLDVGSATHGCQTGEMMKKIEAVLLKEQPDVALVFGDTNTTLAGALVAAKLHIPVAHVESGLRSFDRRMPEEINRVLTDHCSDILFCPTATSVHNLHREGIVNGVNLTGDVMVDAIEQHAKTAEKRSNILEDLDLASHDYVLATVHRAENTDHAATLNGIVDAFREIENLLFVCHPRTSKYLKSYGLWDRLNDRVRVIDPVGYLDMLRLEMGAKKILTDSGGVQKEAYILGVPCITLRSCTEWVETVSDGWNVLAGSDAGAIIRMAAEFEPAGTSKKVFGTGDASRKIREYLQKWEKSPARIAEVSLLASV